MIQITPRDTRGTDFTPPPPRQSFGPPRYKNVQVPPGTMCFRFESEL